MTNVQFRKLEWLGAVSVSQFARLNLRKSPVHLMIFECEPAGKTMFASPSHSEDQRGLRLVAALIAEVLDLVFIAVSQVIKTETINADINNVCKK